MSHFFCRCGEALTKNRQLVNGHEQQIEYHKELERNFYKFTDRLAPLMGNGNAKQALISLRESYFNGFSKPSTLPHGTAGDSTVTGANNGTSASQNSRQVNGGGVNGSNGTTNGKYK